MTLETTEKPTKKDVTQAAPESTPLHDDLLSSWKLQSAQRSQTSQSDLFAVSHLTLGTDELYKPQSDSSNMSVAKSGLTFQTRSLDLTNTGAGKPKLEKETGTAPATAGKGMGDTKSESRPQAPADAAKPAPGDQVAKPVDTPKVASDDAKVVDERKRLSDRAGKHIKNPEQLAKFHDDMAKLEARAKEKNLSADEIANTYKNVERLLDDSKHAKSSLPMSQREVLAQQVMSQAADPTTIRQGFHNTCNVSAVEARTYSLHPSNAANLVAEVALNGSYQSPLPKPHGTLIHLNSKSLKPDQESRINPPKDGDRSFATQIFNVTAVNLVHKSDHTGKVYVNDANGGPEALYDKRKGRTVDDSPDINDDRVVQAYDLINHTDRTKEPVVEICAADNYSGDGHKITKVASEEELMQNLQEAKKNGQLPIILRVDANVEPFWSDSGHDAAGGDAGAHVVTVTDIQDGPPAKISVNNQWRTKDNHFGDNAVPLRQLFIAMHEPVDAEQLLAGDVAEDRKKGKFDAGNELELERLHHFNMMGELKEHSVEEQVAEFKDYSGKLSKVIDKATDNWIEQEESGKLDPAEKERAIEKIKNLIDDFNLPPSGSVKLLRQAHDKGLIDKDSYDKEIGSFMLSMQFLKDAGTDMSKEDKTDYPYWKQESQDVVPALKDAVSGLPAAERKEIIDKILNDPEASDARKFAALRSAHDLNLLSNDDLVKNVGKIFHEFREHDRAGVFKNSDGIDKRQMALKEGRRLLSELPAELSAKIKEAEKERE